jgi:hypothetical protein
MRFNSRMVFLVQNTASGCITPTPHTMIGLRGQCRLQLVSVTHNFLNTNLKFAEFQHFVTRTTLDIAFDEVIRYLKKNYYKV